MTKRAINNGSLFDVLDHERRSGMTWRPEPPPQLASRGVKEVYLDSETTGLNWRKGALPIGAAVKPKGGPSQYVPWAHKGGGNLDEGQCRDWARRELRDLHIRNHSTSFDVHQLRVWGVDLREQNCTFSDVAHTAALLDDTRRRFALDELGKDYLGEGKIKALESGEVIDKTKMSEYHAGEIAPYACRDIDIIEDLDAVMWPQIIDQGLEKVHDLENQVLPAVVEMEANMAPLDMEKLEDWVKRSDQEHKKLLWNLTRDLGFQVDPGKSADMVRVFEKLGIPVVFFTEKGAPSFTDAVLKSLAKEYPAIANIRRAVRLASIRSKYLLPFWTEHVDGYLPYHLHQLRGDEYGTISGRFSSSHRNIQQIMAVEKQVENLGPDYIIRELFVARRRKKLLASDAKQIEFRIFGHHSNSRYIMEAYEKDMEADFHDVVKDMVIHMLPGITRKPVKNLNFAKIYGAGFDKVVMMTGLDPDKAAEFIAIYDRTFPETKALLKYAARLATERGYVKTLMGRRSRCADRPHKALNAVIQGTAADIMKKKLVELYERRRELDLVMMMTVHDEFVGEVEDQEAADRVNTLLNVQSFPLKVDILWDTGIGDNWAAA